MPTIGVVMRNLQKICPDFTPAENGARSQFKNVCYHRNSKVYVASYRNSYKGTGRSDVEALALILEENKDLTVKDFYVPPQSRKDGDEKDGKDEEEEEQGEKAPRGSPKLSIKEKAKGGEEKAIQEGQGEKGAKKRDAPERKEASSEAAGTPPRRSKAARIEASPEISASSKRARKAAASL